MAETEKRIERYIITYVWKILECQVPNFSPPIRSRTSGRSINRLPKFIRMLSSCSVVGFKSKLDSYLWNIVDLPCRPGFNNSLDGGD